MCSRKWLIVALVACGLASACSQYNTNLSIQTSSSVLTFVSPSSATAGSQTFTITANGQGFTSGALILWNGKALITTLVSSTLLTAPVPASLLTTPGTVQVSVQIPGSASSGTNINNTTTTEISNIVLFTIGAQPGAPPALTSLSAGTGMMPSAPYCGAQGFTLTVNGTNFTSDSVVNWNGVPQTQTTTFVSATQLTVSISAVQAAFPGTAAVTVTNSLGTSGSLPFTLSTPTTALATPTITSLSQTSVAAGSPPITLTVTGTNILPCTIVQWVSPSNATTSLATTYVSATQLTAIIPAADFLSAGTAQVKVSTQGPGGGTTSGISFTIAAPSITSVSAPPLSSASTTSCGTSGVILTVNGTNFVNGSVVNWVIPPPGPSGTPTILPLSTTFVSSTQLTAIIPATNTVSVGAVNIEVSNFGALSNSLPFTISSGTLPAPAITAVSPASATAGAASATLMVTGTNFQPCSVVQWTNGGGITTQLPTTYVGATQLNATLPGVDIASVGTAKVAVATPASSANTSAAVSFQIGLATITSLSAFTTSMGNTPYCSPTGLTLTVNGTGFAPGLVVNWNGSPRTTTFVSATQLTAAITAADTAFLDPGSAAQSSPSLAQGSGAVSITVSGSGPGTNSNSLKFSVTALPTGSTLPVPAISSISPTNAAVEPITGPPVALTVNGTNLSPCSAVQWNGSPLPATIFIGVGGIASIIPAANITTTGVAQVAVNTPGAGTSGNEPFTVYTPGSPTTTALPGGTLSLPLMSFSQRFAVYVLASASDGVTETPGSTQNIFLADTCLGVSSGCTASNTIVSSGAGGAAANADSILPSINANSAPMSADGRYVAFLSSATNLVAGGTNGEMDAFVRDTCAGVASGCTPSTQLVSVTTGGTQPNGATTSATIDPTGRYVTFESSATNLGAISASGGIFLRDTCAGAAPGCTPSTMPLD